MEGVISYIEHDKMEPDHEFSTGNLLLLAIVILYMYTLYSYSVVVMCMCCVDWAVIKPGLRKHSVNTHNNS